MVLLPHKSVAVQVRVIVIVDSVQAEALSEKEMAISPELLQLSVAVAIPVLEGLLLWPKAKFAVGGQVITGATISVTVITCKQEVEPPHSSLAVHVLLME